ncbi:hypothetical protein [Flavobacterium nitrogenifigens]|uniref:DUF1963 domain-containing protein n=1 Tax=Flavobacterium nitrogenifigens TaxID=1617283 RepID=A0A521CXJ5_9FLAO|nr:hypothetical protein [Flavobacterium nitrogenifigens]KAF2332108.1 hypothetical protein DM397_11285 [Flavobacterium nitrogenifigens]SMO64148.1 hypothetical protein SAMN06265220_102783 [Flavobacterium nitrogenifigens]
MFKWFLSKKKESKNSEKIECAEEPKPTEKPVSAQNKFDTNKMDWLINDSLLAFMPRELFMHYSDPNTAPDPQDPSWQNQGLYFWKEKEAFENKSLPEFFGTMDQRLFLINEVPDYISLVSGKAMPWFGMPGGGEKFFFRYDETTPVTLEEAHKLNIINYVEIVELNQDNLSVLNDRDNYCFLIDPYEVKYEDQLFYLNGEKISLAELYQKKKLLVLSVE